VGAAAALDLSPDVIATGIETFGSRSLPATKEQAEPNSKPGEHH
jgi:hypothetical protein